jgi:hypothetical protein
MGVGHCLVGLTSELIYKTGLSTTNICPNSLVTAVFWDMTQCGSCMER